MTYNENRTLWEEIDSMKDEALDRIARKMVDGMKDVDRELISELRANDPEFRVLDRRVSEHLRKIHEGEESPPDLESTSLSGL